MSGPITQAAALALIQEVEGGPLATHRHSLADELAVALSGDSKVREMIFGALEDKNGGWGDAFALAKGMVSRSL